MKIRSSEEIENQLEAMGLVVRDSPLPAGNYSPYVINGEILYISGQLSYDAGSGELLTGKVGDDVTLEAGQKAARGAAFETIMRAREATRGADQQNLKIKGLIYVVGFVNTDPHFERIETVVLSALEFLATTLSSDPVTSDFGIVNAAIGCASLPKNATVELSAHFLLGT
jgi:enamine deaminase RidA (YjgF/YER057c/UK114 family)